MSLSRVRPRPRHAKQANRARRRGWASLPSYGTSTLVDVKRTQAIDVKQVMSGDSERLLRRPADSWGGPCILGPVERWPAING